MYIHHRENHNNQMLKAEKYLKLKNNQVFFYISERKSQKWQKNSNLSFEIHTDASKLQLGSVISQHGNPIAFYSRTLNHAQVNYTIIEHELLSIVETLKDFRNILLGQQIEVYKDHKNLTYKTFNTERVMRWRLILEEYNPVFIYI